MRLPNICTFMHATIVTVNDACDPESKLISSDDSARTMGVSSTFPRWQESRRIQVYFSTSNTFYRQHDG